MITRKHKKPFIIRGGKQIPSDPIERFWFYVEKTDSCWIWKGPQYGTGYGMFWYQGQNHRAHRFAFELLVGPFPKDLEPDHLCRVPLCVRPEHIEPVTSRENTLRGMSPAAQCARRDRCANGHIYTAQSTRIHHGGQRDCLICARARRKIRYQLFKAKKLAVAGGGGAR